MNMRPIPQSADVEIDVRALFRSILRALQYIVVIALLVGAATYFLLSRIPPEYRSEATVLIQTGESDLTRTGAGAGSDAILDQEAVASQVQLIRSRDLARAVAAKLQLQTRPEFDPALEGGSLIGNLMAMVGLSKDPLGASVEERVLDRFVEKLDVYAVDKSRVIVIGFSSRDPKLAAEVPNEVAAEYIALQRSVKRDTTADATKWLQAEIDDLRTKVRDAEAKVETFRSSNDLFSGGGATPSTLPQQQLSDLNAELARVRAGRADAEAKTTQIRAAIKAGTALSQSDVINSPLIQRLVEQQVALRASLAQLSATLLPAHPRVRELRAQVADLDKQVENEAQKVLAGLEAEASLSRSREDEILRSLTGLKTVTATANGAEVQLRALEREAAAQRDLLDTYLRRYREALSRQNGDYLPADARIISRAAQPIQPYFPKKPQMSAAAAIGAGLLMIAFIVIRELASGRPMRRQTPHPVPAAVPAADAAGQRWSDDSAVRRMMPAGPTIAPPVIDRVEESLKSIAGEIVAIRAKRVIVTLAEESDANGRPLAAVALARAIARIDVRPVVIDFRGDGANSLSMGETAELPGFSDLFAGGASFAQAIFRDRRSRVHFIPAGLGPLPEDLAGERMNAILQALDLTYDHVILDAGNDLIPVLAPEATVAVVVSEHGNEDTRTQEAFARVTSVSAAKIMLLVVDPAPDEEPATEAADIEPEAKEGAAA
jgi:succinoglycan biosynthesis transport protein ExoP